MHSQLSRAAAAAAVLCVTACRLLKESVVLPLKYPQLFTGLLAPWRGECLTAVLHQECLPGLVLIRQPAQQYGGSTYSSGSMQLARVMLPG
jgi:hypothetical protein